VLRVKSIITRVIFRLFLLALLGGGVWLWFALSPVRHAPGVLIRCEPLRVAGEPVALEPVGGYDLRRVARFHLDARVLGVKRYRDAHASLSPIDVLVGWGPMSDSAVLDRITLRQEERGYRWEARGVPDEVIRRHSANLHLVLANPEVAALVSQFLPGSLVSLRGELVEASRGDFPWSASLSRGDSRGQAGELMRVSRTRWFNGDPDLAAKEEAALLEEAHPDLQRWYLLLREKRDKLDLNDAEAVRAFNREARQYMEAAHPEPSPSPGPSLAPSPEPSSAP